MSNEHVIDEVMDALLRVAMHGAEQDREHARLLSTKHCLLEVQRINGSPEVEFCGRTATAICSDCGTYICDSHAKFDDRGVMCAGCEALQPTKKEMLDVIGKCLDVVNPKHYPSLVREIESILRASGRPV